MKPQTTTDSDYELDSEPDELPSSFFGLLNVADYSFSYTKAAKRAAFAIRSILENLRDESSIRRVAQCFPYNQRYAWPDLATARLNANTVYFNHCRNKNACPVCSRASDASTRRRFSEGFDHFVSLGYQPYWQTLDLGFAAHTSGHERIRITTGIWRKLSQSHKFRSQVTQLNLVSVRVIEFLKPQEEWTPHIHMVWLFGPQVKSKEIQDFFSLVTSLWRKFQSRELKCVATKPDLYSGKLDSSSTAPIAHYLFKAFWITVDDSGVVIPEVAKTPLEHLMHFAAYGDLDALDTWIDYESVSNKVRRYTFSQAWARGCTAPGKQVLVTNKHRLHVPKKRKIPLSMLPTRRNPAGPRKSRTQAK